MTNEEETVEKIVLPVPESLLEGLKDAAGKADITVKEYILRLIDQDIRRAKTGIRPETLAAVLREDSELSHRLRDAQREFDLLTKEQAQETVNMIDAKLDNDLQKAQEIQRDVLPRIAREKERILNEIRDLLENRESEENGSSL